MVHSPRQAGGYVSDKRRSLGRQFPRRDRPFPPCREQTDAFLRLLREQANADEIVVVTISSQDLSPRAFLMAQEAETIEVRSPGLLQRRGDIRCFQRFGFAVPG